MRKSNWAILAILVAASAFFLWLWYYLSFNLIDNPFDLILTIAWWAVVLVAVFAIRAAEKRRQERVRAMYLAPTCLYNSEAGLVTLAPGASPINVVQQLLGELKYNFELADFPEKSDVKFVSIIHTKKFADKGDVWEGQVVTVSRPDDEPQKFTNRDELLYIVEGVPLPVEQVSMPTAPQTVPLGA